MPYFQRPPVDRRFRPTAREALGPGRVSTPPPPPPPVPTGAARALVERAAAILAREPPINDGPVAGLAFPEQALSSLLGLALPSALPAAGSTDDVALLGSRTPTAAGSTASLPLTLANDDAVPIALAFQATDLLSSAGGAIPGRQVSFAPAQLTLPAGGQGTVQIRVAVPAGIPAGTYAGLVQAIGDDSVRSVISLEITG
jgi:hypothetical protein